MEFSAKTATVEAEQLAVAEPFRRRGFGAFLVQELKRVCYEGGYVPAARWRYFRSAVCGGHGDAAPYSIHSD